MVVGSLADCWLCGANGDVEAERSAAYLLARDNDPETVRQDVAQWLNDCIVEHGGVTGYRLSFDPFSVSEAHLSVFLFGPRDLRYGFDVSRWFLDRPRVTERLLTSVRQCGRLA